MSTDKRAEVAPAAGAHDIVAVDGFGDEVRRFTAVGNVDVIVDPD